MTRRFYPFILHGGLLVTGFLCFRMFPMSGPNDVAESREIRGGAVRDSSPGPEVLAILEGVLAGASESPSENYKAEYAQFQIHARRLIHELPDEADPCAALEREIGAENPAYGQPGWRPSPKAAALIYQWLGKDPSAVAAWMHSGGSRYGIGLRLMEVAMDEAVKSPERLGTILACVQERGENTIFLRPMAGALAENPDAGKFEQVRESLAPSSWTEFCGNLARTWPPEKRDGLLNFAVQYQRPDMLVESFEARSKIEAGSAAWLMKAASDPSLSAEFKESLMGEKRFGQIIAADSSAPLALRVQFAEGASESGKYATLCRLSVQEAMDEGVNWNGLMHSGEVSAAEVLKEVEKGLPELAAAAPEELRTQVFARLAEEDGPAALRLLDGLPPERRNEAILEAAGMQMVNVPPDDFLAMLREVPSDSAELWESRLDAWARRAPLMNVRSGGDLADWVQNLPAGDDREMALYALARGVEQGNGELATKLRNLVTDPKLRQRISDKR